MFTALAARDASRLMRFYARDASVLHVPGTPIIQTDTIAPYTTRGLAALEAFDVTWTPHSLHVLSPDLTVRTILLTFRTTPKGRSPQSSSSVQALVLKRTPQG